MFSFETGTPFAFITGGRYDGQVLKINDEITNEEFNFTDPIDFLNEMGFFRTLKKEPKKTFQQLREMIINEKEELDPELEPLYEQAKRVLKERAGKEFFLNDGGQMMLIPNMNPNKRQQIYVAAATGSGKTAFACEFLKYYQMEFPERRVIVFTQDVQDPTIKDCVGLTPTLIDLDEKIQLQNGQLVPSIIAQPIDTKELGDAAVLFDDIELITDKAIKNAVLNLRDRAMGVGRHDNVTVVITGHLLTNYQKTRSILSECDFIVAFPHGGTARGLEYFMSSYLGIKEKKTQNRILNLPSRWVAFHTHYPQFCLYQSGCFLLKDLK